MDRRKSLVCDNTLEDGSPSLTSLQRTFLAALFIFVATVVNSDAQTLPAGARPTNDEADLDVIVRAGGLLNPSEDTGGAGASLGLQFVPNEKWFFDVQFSLSGNNDLTGSQADFGSYVLNPSTDGMGFHGQARYVIESPFAVSGGFGGSGTAWEAMVGPDGDLTKTRFEGFILYGNVALQIATQVKDGGDDKNKIWLGIEIGPAFRTFGGDLGLMDDFRASPKVLGVGDTSFMGLQVTAFAELNDRTRPYARFTRYGDGSIAGLSRWQWSLGVDVIGTAFNLK